MSRICSSFVVGAVVSAVGWGAAPALADLTVGPAHTVNTAALGGVSCSGPTSCEAIAPGYSFPINPSGVLGTAAALPFPNVSAVGCASGTSNCEAVGDDGQQHADDAPIAAGVPGAAHVYPDIVSTLSGVACSPGTNACVAVGRVTLQGPSTTFHALVVPISSGGPGAGQYPPGDQVQMNAVACPADNCVAVGAQGAVWSLTASGGASAAQYSTGSGTVANLFGVACATTSSCVAVGTGGAVVPITGGTPGARQFVPGVNLLSHVACASATTCLAVGTSTQGTSVLVPITSGTPGTPIDITGDGATFFVPSDIACAGAGCLAVGSQGGNHGVVLPISTAASTTTSLSSTPNPSTAGQTVTFTAAVSPSGGGGPTGSVSFSDGSTSLGTSSLSGGTASLTTSTLTAGSHIITAVYSGDANFAPSSSAQLNQSVTGVAGDPTPTPTPTRTLSVGLTGTGTGSISGTGIACPATCSGTYAVGTTIVLTETPAVGSSFAGWSGACSGTDSTCTVVMDLDHSVTAAFTTTAGPPPPTLRCALRAVSTSVLLTAPKKHTKSAKKPSVGTLAVSATCDASVSVRVSGSITAVVKGKKGKPTRKTFKLTAASIAVRATKATVLTFKLPAGALSLLARHTSESAAFSLTASGGAAKTTTTLAISRISGH